MSNLGTALKLMNISNNAGEVYSHVEDSDEAAAVFMRSKFDEVLFKRLIGDNSDYKAIISPGEIVLEGTESPFEGLPSDYYLTFISFLANNPYTAVTELFDNKLGDYRMFRISSQTACELDYYDDSLCLQLEEKKEEILMDVLFDMREVADIFPHLEEMIMEMIEYDPESIQSELFLHIFKSHLLGWFEEQEDDGSDEYGAIHKAFDVFCKAISCRNKMLSNHCFYGYYVTGSEGDGSSECPFSLEHDEIAAYYILSELLPDYYKKKGGSVNDCAE